MGAGAALAGVLPDPVAGLSVQMVLGAGRVIHQEHRAGEKLFVDICWPSGAGDLPSSDDDHLPGAGVRHGARRFQLRLHRSPLIATRRPTEGQWDGWPDGMELAMLPRLRPSAQTLPPVTV